MSRFASGLNPLYDTVIVGEWCSADGIAALMSVPRSASQPNMHVALSGSVNYPLYNETVV